VTLDDRDNVGRHVETEVQIILADSYL
jgi:hypothetical protein